MPCRPYGFLERFDPDFTPNTTDLSGRRYSYRNQTMIGHWNVAQLANAFITGGLVNQVPLLFLTLNGAPKLHRSRRFCTCSLRTGSNHICSAKEWMYWQHVCCMAAHSSDIRHGLRCS